MATKKRSTNTTPAAKGIIENAGVIIEQEITSTLETNYMPYAMSVIMSRAIPEIDGFKPSHRKLLFTMYKMGLLNGAKVKSANIAGQTMWLNPHGDQAIYETMVRMTTGNEALLHPYVESKGSFGKAYSRDMQPAAARYTEAKLAQIAVELFGDIDKDAVDMADNYDGTMKEPVLLPVTFPSILVNNNTGIAVGMASSICSFNLSELCETTIAYIYDEGHDLLSTMPAPDFPGGGQILYNREAMEQIYKTGRGSVRVRSRYEYDKAANCIDITKIPPSTTVEAIIEKVIDMIKNGRIKEIADIRDEIGLNGLKITIDLKRGIDPVKLMQKLYKFTPLEDSFSCNFNILIAGQPRVMGVRDILEEWLGFRVECIRRRTYFTLNKKKDKLHLLKGLEKILLDIDKAVRIVRETDEEAEVVPNLMIGFGIDEIQAEYVAEIKLRHLNREYILKRTQEIESLIADIEAMESLISSNAKIKRVIVDELKDIIKKYGQPRKTLLIHAAEEEEYNEVEEIPDYPVNLFFTKEGYFKKITPQSLRMSGEHKLKDGDEITQSLEASNAHDLLFFTDKCQVYKAKAYDFEDTKASVMGDYVPAKLGMEEGESIIKLVVTKEYNGYVTVFFENGKAAKIELSQYATKTNRKKLVNALSDKSKVTDLYYIENDCEFLLRSSGGHLLLVHSGAISPKTTKNTQGVQVMTLRKNQKLALVKLYQEGELEFPHRYRKKNIPSAGSFPTQEELGEQMSLI
ncbi:MAG: topoisomerase IV [Oscillospiraceae bacterium]|jgi:DNA gyrase subunit A|nr:topoisomerase IV [Oscillospiraceae bacterium]